MYTAFLVIHSLLRWSAIIVGIGATFMAFTDLPRRSDSVAKAGREGAGRADRWGLALMVALDLQMLVGLSLYLLMSPITREAMRNFGAAMTNPGLRFYAVEHPAMMIAAIVLTHVGRVLARKAPSPSAKRTRLIVCFGLATALMLIATPWPGTANGRPLVRVS